MRAQIAKIVQVRCVAAGRRPETCCETHRRAVRRGRLVALERIAEAEHGRVADKARPVSGGGRAQVDQVTVDDDGPAANSLIAMLMGDRQRVMTFELIGRWPTAAHRASSPHPGGCRSSCGQNACLLRRDTGRVRSRTRNDGSRNPVGCSLHRTSACRPSPCQACCGAARPWSVTRQSTRPSCPRGRTTGGEPPSNRQFRDVAPVSAPNRMPPVDANTLTWLKARQWQ